MLYRYFVFLFLFFCALLGRLWLQPETLEASSPHTYYLYFPSITKADPLENVRPFRFSFSGSADAHLIEAALPVPERFRADPYMWNVVPNPASRTQMIRACHGRPHQGYCWDREAGELISNHSVSLGTWAAEHPGLTWLIGNEPDNFDLEAGDGLRPSEYGRFYAAVAGVIQSADSTATLVFCQTTFPFEITWTNWQFPYNSGINYCAKAYWTVAENLPEGVNPADIIDVVSTHLYIIDVREVHLERSFNEWKQYLADFATWVNEFDDGALRGRPLYLTEFGALGNVCEEALAFRPDIDMAGGVGCEQGEPFFGRHDGEGFWGLQVKAIELFLSEENTQWEAAWWFFTGCGESWLKHGGLFESCGKQPILSRAGETWRDTLQYHLIIKRY